MLLFHRQLINFMVMNYVVDEVHIDGLFTPSTRTYSLHDHITTHAFLINFNYLTS